MDKPTYKLVGQPCGQHGQYTFYKAIRICSEREHIIAIGDFFFVRIWQDSELVSIGELQLLWTDRVSDQTLVSLRLYFLPENTPEGRNLHGEIRLACHLLVALLLGALYYGGGNDANRVLSNTACLFFFLLFLFFANAMPTINTFPAEANVVLREHLNKWYSLPAYCITKLIVDVPFQILCATAFFFPAWFLTGQLSDPFRLLMSWTICLLITTLAQTFGLVVGAACDIEDEVVAINEKVVLRADDLLSWMCTGAGWRWGLRAVCRDACAPPSAAQDGSLTSPLHCSKMDFSDVDREKNALNEERDRPGVVVFSYPRYCRYRALLRRLDGIQAAWLRDSLVAALGGYAAPTENTRILYCKETFEYPELEGHEFVCNHLAPRLKGRPRGRRRKRSRTRSRDRDRDYDARSASGSDSGNATPLSHDAQTPRRPALRNGADKNSDDEHDDVRAVRRSDAEDRAFLSQLRAFYKERSSLLNVSHSLKDLSLRALYQAVSLRGGYAAVCRERGWRRVHASLSRHHRAVSPSGGGRVRRHYERILLPYENYEKRNGSKLHNGTDKQLATPEKKPIETIDMTIESPLRDIDNKIEEIQKRLRTPSPQKPTTKYEIPSPLDTNDLNITSKPASELNQEFLDSLPKQEEEKRDAKVTVKPVSKLIETKPPIKTGQNLTEYLKTHVDLRNIDARYVNEDLSAAVAEIAAQLNLNSHSVLAELTGKQALSETSNIFLAQIAQKLNLGKSSAESVPSGASAGPVALPATTGASVALAQLSCLGDKYAAGANGSHHQNGLIATSADQRSRPAGRSSLRSVRVKPARAHTAATVPGLSAAHTPPVPPPQPDSASSSPPMAANFSLNYAPQVTSSNHEGNSDDEIVEVPYKPNTPEIIDLDEYPESPQSAKKKKLDILKERGLEVTPIPNDYPPPGQMVAPPILGLNPAMQHQIMTQAQLFQMYNMMPSNYANGIQPPKVIQGKSIFGTTGPEKIVYGNPKDPFMPPPHILQGAPIKPTRIIAAAPQPPQDILDLTCKPPTPPAVQKPAVEIVRVPNVPCTSPKMANTAQNLSKNYTLLDGKAVVGSNLEITLVSPKQTSKPRPPQKRSSNGKFMSNKTPQKETKPYPSSPRPTQERKPNIVVPTYQVTRDDTSPTSSTGSRESVTYKNPPQASSQMPPFMDPVYVSALYSSLASQLDPRQLAVYRDLMAGQFRGYSSLLNMGVASTTPTTKN